ncbi:MAG: ATP-binding protein [Pseudomonadota bacterium]
MSDSQWKARFERERNARQQAERILEDKSRELYEANQNLLALTRSQDVVIEERTKELHATIEQLKGEAEKRKEASKELRVARDEALELAQVKTDFLARMSHEIRTPMNAIIGLTGVLLDKIKDAELASHLLTVRSSGHLLLRLINDILDFSKVDAGKIELEYNNASLESVIQQSVSLVMLEADKKESRFEIQRAEGLPENIVIDAGRVVQVLSNLVNNAVKFSENDIIKIAVEVSKESIRFDDVPAEIRALDDGQLFDYRFITFAVTDRGIGIHPDKIDTLFDPFTQFAGASPGSSGLGLAICKSLCECMGGDIWVTSQPGEGSTFIIRFICGLETATRVTKVYQEEVLDCSEETGRHLLLGDAALAAKLGEAPLASSKPLRILIADDYEVNRIVQQAQLDALGYRADTVANGEEVLRAIHARDYDLIMMDIRMPIMDGEETTRRIRSHADHQPYIAAVTASALNDDQKRFAKAGFDRFLAKPVDAAELVETLEAAFEHKHGQTSVQMFSNSELIEIEPLELDHEFLTKTVGPALNQVLARVVPVFLRDLPDRCISLEKSVKTKDAESFASICHGLKGASRSVGGMDLSEMCASFEERAYSGYVANEDELVEMTSMINRTRRALERKLATINDPSEVSA